MLYELRRRGPTTAGGLIQALRIDAGYLSRILRRFEKGRLVAKAKVAADGRQSLLTLTTAGSAAFASLDARSRAAIGELLAPLPAADQDRLVAAMGAVERTLGAGAPDGYACRLRAPRPGDMGWIIQRHGALYAEEYGWDQSFEVLVAEVATAFGKRHDPRREHCWIAELDGDPVGAVLLVQHSPDTAQLRLLLVEPRARGLGIGARLVHQCLAFAKDAGYGKVTLWTQSILAAARHIYAQAGFELVRQEPHRSFGQDLLGELWEIRL